MGRAPGTRRPAGTHSVAESELTATARRIISTCSQLGISLASAESLTGGRFVASLVDVPGASAVVRGGLVTYATDLKASLAGVNADHLEETGPIDPVVAAQMAVGTAVQCVADIGISCTGVAGPDPQDDKPVGLVYTAIAFGGKAKVFEHEFTGDRDAIRSQTVQAMAVNLDEFVRELAFGPEAGQGTADRESVAE
ncbi:CinA family protein [Brevibacterium linens ATCC 9172]|uniref:Competence/damage-inducible protein cinA n=1 Tax=Brevibacterium linens ATCC 9172 TaxID=1255617 RepID=A0A2H1HWC8_BRELN|nr:CinA family protein [Brevibacterium linens ATCC 9172]SMX67221.1 competence/damage-inducible protein cinA [Brevibacterium linens ATCC 9172]